MAAAAAARRAASTASTPAPTTTNHRHRLRRLIIDTDAGVDDCQALLMALGAHARGDVTIECITCVGGNVHVDKVLPNVRRCLAAAALQTVATLEIAADTIETETSDTSGNSHHIAAAASLLTIPIYKGCSEPLIKDPDGDGADAKFWHGTDGLGNASSAVDQQLAEPGCVDRFKIIQRTATTRPAKAATAAYDPNLLHCPTSKDHPALKIAEMCMASPGEISIVAIGPLTNIALACKLFPNFPASVRDFVFMGGTRFARGNANLTAEFNAFADPEALQICLRYFKGKQTMVGWDLTARCGMPFDWVYGNWLADAGGGLGGPRPAAAFLSLVSADIVHKSRNGPWRDAGLLVPDPLAMAVAIDPSVVVESVRYFATVELAGKRSRGMMVLDYDGLFTPLSKIDDAGGAGTSTKNLLVATEIDLKKVQALMCTSTGS